MLPNLWLPPRYKTNCNSKIKPMTTSTINDPFSNMNVEHCQGVLSILQSHLAKVKTESLATTNTSSSAAPSPSHIVGTCYSLPKYKSDLPSWVMDSRETAHICYSRELFTSIKPVIGFNISFPNHTRLSVKFFGTIHLSPDLLPEDVLFIPEF